MWSRCHSIAFFALLCCSVVNFVGAQELLEPCENLIYCQGDLLKTVQLSNLYKDDKTFVDFALKRQPDEVLAAFAQLGFTGNVSDNPENLQKLKDFVSTNFDTNENGTEFEPWTPTDWEPNPQFLNFIQDPKMKSWANKLHEFWEVLGRKIKPDVATNPQFYSMHYVSHPVIVPGGRFKEFYYWDSYWIQKGLLISGMTTTVRGMIENFVEMVQKKGFIPNGGRIYYERAQPPLFIPMVKNYYEATKNVTFLEIYISDMEDEFEFFMSQRTVNFTVGGEQFTLARYNVDMKNPRPESYSKDYELVEELDIDQNEKDILYANLKAGAESGWDFSSRWFVVDGNLSEGVLSDTKVRDIIPVDLNGFLYWNAVILAEFCGMDSVTCRNQTSYYEAKAGEWKNAIHKVLWDCDEGSWFDYDFVRGHLRKEFYPTNIVPLWVKAHHDNVTAARIVEYFHRTGATEFEAGIPSSMIQTGEQWDFPNGWAPLNHMVVEALEFSGNEKAQELAFDIAQKWTRTNLKAYEKTEHMFEKYDVTTMGLGGGGGEYEVVVGFGWTNGVILDFLNLYGDRITALPEMPSKASSSTQFGFLSLAISILSVIYSTL